MPRLTIPQSIALVAAFLSLVGCTAEEPASPLLGGYTFSRDLDDERRVLQIEPSVEHGVECMWIDLPVEGDGNWKEVDLSADIHSALLALVEDEARALQYAADTEASTEYETFVCKTQLDGKEFCYAPQLGVTGVSPPWRLALHPDVELSAESEELIEQFLVAHEACWNGGNSMKDDSDD